MTHRQTNDVFFFQSLLIIYIIQTLKLNEINFYEILIAEQQRENDRALRKAGRDIERERRTLEAEENKIVSNKWP